jgi:[ribosomal protein S5]-alanine N-acetyltransferase
VELLDDRAVNIYDLGSSRFSRTNGGSMPIPVVETDRLQLRPFVLSDAVMVQTLAGAAEVAATTTYVPHPYPDGAAEMWIRSLAEPADTGPKFTWAITDRSDGALMGAISIVVHDRHRRGVMGYWLGVPFWNRGYMTEAAKAVVNFAFARLDLHRAQAMILPRNGASIRVAEKAGLLYEGTLRGYNLKGSVFEDMTVYGKVSD